jgi:protein-tyrosine phosphatase
MRVDGIIPIVTHPERNPTLVRNLELLKECVRFGCLIQITAGSLIGGFGRTAQHISNELIKRQWVHVISSDAHTIEGRPPAMKPAYSYLKDHFGQDEADRLCTRNPRSIFMGEALLPGPGPIGVYEDAERVKKGFLRRIFRR